MGVAFRTDVGAQAVPGGSHVPPRLWQREEDGHDELTITLTAQGEQAPVGWCEVVDTAAERQRIADFVTAANEQNLDRLAAEVLNVA